MLIIIVFSFFQSNALYFNCSTLCQPEFTSAHACMLLVIICLMHSRNFSDNQYLWEEDLHILNFFPLKSVVRATIKV